MARVGNAGEKGGELLKSPRPVDEGLHFCADVLDAFGMLMQELTIYWQSPAFFHVAPASHL